MAMENLCTTKPEKQVFQLRKSRKDGLLLQVHHSVLERGGEIQRVRFTNMAFNKTGERLAAVDHRGNVFVIDLLTCKVWSLPSLGICTVVAFSPQSDDTLVVGTTDCYLSFMNTETGSVTQSLKDHTLPVKQVSFSCQGHFCLSMSLEEAIIWNLTSGCVAHRLALHTDVAIKQVMFIPSSNCVLVCFQNDSMNVWNFETLECVRQIVPDMWRGNHLKAITFTRNGHVMVVGGHSPQLIVLFLDTWSLRKCVLLPDHVSGVKHIEFLPQEFDAGANKILAVLSTNCLLYFLDVETECFLKTNLSQECSTRKFACSVTGKYVATLLHSGEVNIYQSSRLLDCGADPKEMVQARKDVEKRSPGKRSLGKQKRFLEKQMKAELQLQRLQPILKQFGEYPEPYRGLIWRTVTQLPQNQAAFVSLVNKECHLAYRGIDRAFPQETRTVMKNLRRILSCLVHWCPLFAEVKYLPQLALPFVVVFQNNPLDCFELLLTIIVNWCQHWFEYFLYPPANVLSMVENVMEEHDPELLQFLCDHNVTSELYAWNILQTGFSQVLSRNEWCVLWDHVLSHEPCFLLMAVAAYNIVCRAAIKSCKSTHDIQLFYQSRSALDMKRFLSKCHQLLNVTSDDVHPRQYLKKFQSLESGVYPVFTSYSKFSIDQQVQLLEDIRAENEQLASEYRVAMEREAEKEDKRKRQVSRERHEERLLCAEDAFHAEILKEEFRVAQQRRKVLELHRELRARELEVVVETSNVNTCQNMRQRQASLSRALDLVKLQSCREEAVVTVLEEEMRSYIDQLKIEKLREGLAFRDDRNSSESAAEHKLKVRELESQMKKLETEMQCLLEKLAKRRQHKAASAGKGGQSRQSTCHQQDMSSRDNLGQKVQSTRGWDLYQKEKEAIKYAMLSREKFLSIPNISKRHLGSLDIK